MDMGLSVPRSMKGVSLSVNWIESDGCSPVRRLGQSTGLAPGAPPTPEDIPRGPLLWSAPDGPASNSRTRAPAPRPSDVAYAIGVARSQRRYPDRPVRPWDRREPA